MEQMISNIWQVNALLGGILVFLILVTATFLTLLMIIFAPFRKNNDD